MQTLTPDFMIQDGVCTVCSASLSCFHNMVQMYPGNGTHTHTQVLAELTPVI